MSGKIRLYGSTSGYNDIAAPAIADNSTIDLSLIGDVADKTGNTYLAANFTSNTFVQDQLSSLAAAGSTLETFASLCDGSSVTVSSGTYTTTDVTAVQTLSATYADVTGSAITYTPPSDASRVIYEFSFYQSSTAGHDIGHYRFYIDGVEATDARLTISSNTILQTKVVFTWIVSIGSANASTGAQATWTTGKEMKLQVRAYAAGNDPKLHGTYYWDGTTSQQFSRPMLTITAIK